MEKYKVKESENKQNLFSQMYLLRWKMSKKYLNKFCICMNYIALFIYKHKKQKQTYVRFLRTNL